MRKSAQCLPFEIVSGLKINQWRENFSDHEIFTTYSHFSHSYIIKIEFSDDK